MERIALDAGAQQRRIQERQIEGSVMSHQHRAPAAVAADRGTHGAKDALQRIALVDRGTQRMPRIDLVDQQRRRVEARVLEWTHMERMRFAAMQTASRVDVD